MSNGLLRSGVIYAVANAASAGVPFLLLPLLTRALPPAEYGKVIAFYMLVVLTSAFAGLGLQSAVAVQWMKPGDVKERMSHTGNAVMLTFATTIAVALLSAAIAPHFFHELDVLTCLLAPIAAGGLVLQAMRFAIWQAGGQALHAGALQVGAAVLNIGLSLIGVLLLHLGGWGRIAGATVAGALVAALSVVLMWRHRELQWVPCRRQMRALLHFGVPLIPHTFAGAMLSNADRLVIAHRLGADSLGVYGVAFQLGLVVNVIADAVLKAFTPMLYRLLSQHSALARLKVVGIAYLSVPVWLTLAVLLWIFFRLAGTSLLGGQYVEALGLSIWFLLGGAVSAVYLNFAGLFFFTGKTGWISLATVSSSIVSLLAAYFLASVHGTRGAAAAYLLSQLTLATLAGLLSNRVHPMPWTHPVLALRAVARMMR